MRDDLLASLRDLVTRHHLILIRKPWSRESGGSSHDRHSKRQFLDRLEIKTHERLRSPLHI